MNIVALVGNAATAPELRHTTSGKAMCRFRIAISRPGGEHADFIDIVCWERQAEVVNEYVQLGRRVAIDGRLRQTSWDAEDGRRSKVEVIAHRVDLLGGRREGAPAPAAQEAVEVV
ncbi:MAG: hypothetical protein JWL76_365 [Thermoleophilia bacterium]|nr:hypothetical protein [Thermoleophilia bacterium]